MGAVTTPIFDQRAAYQIGEIFQPVGHGEGATVWRAAD